MSTTPTTPVKKDKKTISSDENQKGIDNHKKAADHLDSAPKKYLEADKNHAKGEHEKGNRSAVKAQGSTAMATKAQKEIVKQHTKNK